MARYTGPEYKKSRRVGFSILESGKELARKPYGPGQHGRDKKAKPSNYGLQLQEKQKIKFMYGLNERQFRKTFEEATKMRGIAGEDFLKLLESRLDNLVYRIGFATTRRAARQLVSHGHVLVNGKKVDIPSYSVKPGSTITLKDDMKENSVIKSALEAQTNRVEYISYDDAKKEATYIRLPERSELSADINESLVVEFYSR
ncbi:MAG: 30S ribosomal protein S4 [Bacilli bacterium]|jgi:small subunit ribosomal protein S4